MKHFKTQSDCSTKEWRYLSPQVCYIIANKLTNNNDKQTNSEMTGMLKKGHRKLRLIKKNKSNYAVCQP